ncbi:BamA/TamA family outer membrane protein [candidate division KSB1 bacterium]|nr:BamA/TamA family outer membrane protein [candidate division KSB1 bacterium]
MIEPGQLSDRSGFIINEVQLLNNEKTSNDVILRELYFTVGDTVTFEELALAQKRLLNLFLFNRVVFDLIDDDERYKLIIDVSEMWYIFPVPVFYLNERSWDKISYGAKILYYNFLGRNILLNLTAAFGYNPEWKFSYRNPWFGGDLKLFTNISIFKSRVRTQTLQYEASDDKRIGISCLLGRRFGKYFYTSALYEYVEISHPLITMSADLSDKLSSYGLTLSWDDRDLVEYPHRGMLASVWGRKTVGDRPINYWRYGFDLRSYIPVSRGSTLAVRTALKLSERKIPLYDRTFFGYEERIRGHFYDKFEGENLATGSIELRVPIRHIRYLDLSEFALPGFEKYFQNLKYGVSTGVFYDFGMIWFQQESPDRDDFLSGFGAGLHIHLPYVDLFRLEVAFDSDWNQEYIAEISTAF